MRKFLSSFLLTSVLVLNLSPALLSSSAVAQRRSARTRKAAPSLATQRGADTITAAQMKDYLSFIASDMMEGRDTPSRGLDITALFLATNLARWGFKPAGDDGSFFQKIALNRDVIDVTQTQVMLNNQKLQLGDDYIPLARPVEVAAPLVFAGNGWFVKAKNIDSYKGIDAKGKIAIVFTVPDGLPEGITRADLQGKRGEDWMGPAEYAAKQGAVAMVQVPDFQYLANWDRNRIRLTERGATTVEKFQPTAVAQTPAIVAAPQLTNTLFQNEKMTATALFNAINGKQTPQSFELNPEKKLAITIRNRSDGRATQNVVAVFEGSDPVLKNEYVALGAHYDHVGVAATPVNGDTVYNGADDDGSGTTALLAMAEALAKASTRPKRSILFVWHAGEEKGLWGSRYFTEFPTVPLKSIVAQVNLDMIGRSKKDGDTNPKNNTLSGPNHIYVIGSKMMSTELGELTERVNSQYENLTYDFRYDDPGDPNRYFFRSDHINYARKGIPIVFFFDGEHADYHALSDSVEKIDYQKMEKVTRTIYMTVWEIAMMPTRPVVDKQLLRAMGGVG